MLKITKDRKYNMRAQKKAQVKRKSILGIANSLTRITISKATKIQTIMKRIKKYPPKSNSFVQRIRFKMGDYLK